MYADPPKVCMADSASSLLNERKKVADRTGREVAEVDQGNPLAAHICLAQASWHADLRWIRVHG
jgi:hypothetical protein